MFVGQPSGRFVPWALGWACDQNSALRYTVAREFAVGAYKLRERAWNTPQDILQPDDDRPETELHRGRNHSGLRVHFKWWRKRLIWSVALLALLAPLSCHLTQRFEAEFTRASLLFQHGRLADSQELSARLGRKLQTADPQLAVKFRILEAESAVW